MKSFQTDYQMGVMNERVIYQPLKEFFGTDLKPTKLRYTKYDFYDKENTYELKTRDCKLNSFSTTVIGEDKIIPSKKGQYFIFNFTDAIACIKYDKEAFKKYKVDLYKRNRRDDFTDNLKNYIYIPVGDLTIIKRKPRRCMINSIDLL